MQTVHRGVSHLRVQSHLRGKAAARPQRGAVWATNEPFPPPLLQRGHPMALSHQEATCHS